MDFKIIADVHTLDNAYYFDLSCNFTIGIDKPKGACFRGHVYEL